MQDPEVMSSRNQIVRFCTVTLSRHCDWMCAPTAYRSAGSYPARTERPERAVRSGSLRANAVLRVRAHPPGLRSAQS